MITKLHFAGLGLIAGAILMAGVVGSSLHFSLQNPGFEKGLASWLGAERFKDEVAIAAGCGRSGSQCLRISMREVSTTLPGVHQRLVNLEAGATYRFSAWIRGVKGKGTTSVKLKLDFYNARGENTSIHPVVRAAEVAEGWMPVEVTALADSDSVLVDAIVTVTGAGSAEIDDVCFEKIAERPDLRLSSAPQALEPDRRSPVLLQASFKRPYREKSPPPFQLAIDGEPLTPHPEVRRIDDRTFSLTAMLPPMASGARSITLSCGSFQAVEAVKVEVSPRLRRPPFLGDGGEHRRGDKLFFPIGIYNVLHTETEYAALAAHGFNMIQGKFPGDLDDFVESLDLALRHKIAVDVPLYAGGRVEANVPKSLELLRRAGRHPAVLCWKIFDEPDADQHVAIRKEVPRTYAALKAANPRQPLELTLCQEDAFGYWTRFCDVVQVDRYPLPGGSISEIYDACVKAKETMEPWQNLTFVLQCGWTRDLKTQPTASQARAMVYLALIGGARGISWYSKREETGWDLTTTPLWPRLAEINAEIRALATPLLLGRKTEIRCDAPSVRLSGHVLERKLYLLLCNAGDRTAEAVVRLPDPPANARWNSPRAMNDPSQRWPVEDGILRLSLKPIESLTVILDLENRGHRDEREGEEQ